MHCWYINLLTHNFEPLDEMLNRWTERVFVGRNAKPLDEMLNRWTKRVFVQRMPVSSNECPFCPTVTHFVQRYGNRYGNVTETLRKR